jgi:hypothetical protein
LKARICFPLLILLASATIFGETPGEISAMNNGMRYGLVWNLAPRYYNDSADKPLTRPLARHVGELIRIHKEYSDLLFGRFNDRMGAIVHGDPNIRYFLFKPLHASVSGEARVGLDFADAPESANVCLGGMSGDLQIATPYHSDQAGQLPLHLTIPARQLAVLVDR